MLQHSLSILTVCYFALSVFATAARVALPESSTDLSLKVTSSQRKRQPATPQEQGSINSVSTPGQQTQNVTSTAGEGNGTDPDPGVITNAAATPISDEVNCTDMTTGRDNKCWGELKLTQWVQDWVDTNACYTGEAFASCFLRKEGFPGLDCTGIRIDTCTSPQGDNVLQEPEVFYVAYNIYGKYFPPRLEFDLRQAYRNEYQRLISSSSRGGQRLETQLAQPLITLERSSSC